MIIFKKQSLCSLTLMLKLRNPFAMCINNCPKKMRFPLFKFVNTYIFTVNIIIFIIHLLNLKPSVRVVYFLDALQTDMVNYESTPKSSYCQTSRCQEVKQTECIH